MVKPLVMLQVVSTIDSRTTTICLHAAGMMVEPGQPFHTLAGDFYHPPFHVHCRSIVQPWQPGYASDVRRRANTELQRRPIEQRRIGPNGPGYPVAPPADGNQPANQSATSTPSATEKARRDRVQQKRDELADRIKRMTEEQQQQQHKPTATQRRSWLSRVLEGIVRLWTNLWK